MNDNAIFESWFRERSIEDVEAFVPDMAGAARGKVLPAHKFGTTSMKMPESVFSQTVSGEYVDNKKNVEDRDMLLVPNPATLRPVPWANDPAASVFLDCFRRDGSSVDVSPRNVLRKVLARYEEKGWLPLVAPEVEFYLLSPHTDPNIDVEPPEGRLGWTDGARQPYSIDQMNDFDPFINRVYEYCEVQGIKVDALSQEAGPAQFEINFLHGNPIDLADQVFLFKRTIREAAIEHEMRATFLAKPMSEDAGSALHIHQSVVDKQGDNIFSNPDGTPSRFFHGFLGGLQAYVPGAMLIFAPYVNSYKRFLNPSDSPVNLAWAIDNRTVGLRVPDSAPEARRVENRLGGSDVNPYLALAATLACGYLGMVEGLTPTDPIEGSAYGNEFGLHRHILSAIEALRNSAAMRSILGDEFVSLYCALKEAEYMEFQEIITPWEREILMFNV
ncbi:MAG TPA: glutamine synthetase family protein [Woeseiaceae bacterium]|nr:glutamine synthetase family protein [Woeseiaceae bacterium]